MIFLFKFLLAHVHRASSILLDRIRLIKSKKKCLVIAWNLSHNPVGRAFLFADFLKSHFDTKLVGPIFKQYGERLWNPLRGYPISVESFEADNSPNFFKQAKEFAKTQEPVDMVVICKPRLPSIYLGLLIAQKNNAKVILDIDDHELSFFTDQSPLLADQLKRMNPEELHSPHSEAWTRYCESLVSQFHYKTVSNHCLHEKFGGIIIPHVRDELAFNPNLYFRDKIRKRFGYTAKDKVILFLGTPRSHKGFMEIPMAIERLNNPNYKLCLIGKVRGDRMKNEMDLSAYPFIQTVTDAKFQNLPRKLMIADLICLLQDPDSAVSQFQMPAKLTDALAMGIPILATPVNPIKPLIDKGLVECLNPDDNLADKIDAIFSNYAEHKSKALKNRRKYFKKYFSYKSAHKQLNTSLANSEAELNSFDSKKLLTELQINIQELAL